MTKFVVQELNISCSEVEALLITLILDNKITGRIDQVHQLVLLEKGCVYTYLHTNTHLHILAELSHTHLHKQKQK